MQNTIKHNAQPHQPPNKGLIAGYASYFDIVDQTRDRIIKGAFTKTLRAWRLAGKMPKMLWQHDPKQPIGVWTHLHEDNQGLYAEGRLTLGVAKADEAFLLLKEGALEGLSIGFHIIKAQQDRERKARILLDIDLVEISLVTFGANAKATVSVVGG
ncbi:MAG TPA: HK97 family phage prohead protease [Alphaproteobacteria bacterium]|nr:HK97 family phage prohead protease [Alphaproteobacteria bacterium]